MPVKITKAEETNIDANTAAPINLTLHSMFRDIALKLKCWRHKPAVPVPLNHGKFAQLLQGDL